MKGLNWLLQGLVLGNTDCELESSAGLQLMREHILTSLQDAVAVLRYCLPACLPACLPVARAH